MTTSCAAGRHRGQRTSRQAQPHTPTRRSTSAAEVQLPTSDSLRESVTCGSLAVSRVIKANTIRLEVGDATVTNPRDRACQLALISGTGYLGGLFAP